MDKTKDDINKKNISPENEETKEATKEEDYPSVFIGHHPSHDLHKLKGNNTKYQSGK